ncbi:MAG: response regulator [Telluria sp.]
MRVLLIEDDELISHGILAGLRAHGLTADAVTTAAQGEAAVAHLHCDIVILDLGLPDEDGAILLARIRAAGFAVPVLVLSARDTVEDRVALLRAGADDYLLKPFDLDELIARLHALTRRVGGRSVDLIVDGPLSLDPASGDVTLDGKAVSLSRRAFALLAALLQARGRVLSPAQLKDRLYDFSEEIESNALSVHIHHLRRKLGPGLVETVRGMGYRFGSAGL